MSHLVVPAAISGSSESKGEVAVEPTISIDSRKIQELYSYYRAIYNGFKLSPTKISVPKDALKRSICPSLISEKLFQKLFMVYSVQTDTVDLREFFVGLSSCCAGNIDEKLGFCFSLFDDDQDGQLAKDQLEQLLFILFKLNQVNREILRSKSTLIQSFKQFDPTAERQQEIKVDVDTISTIPPSTEENSSHAVIPGGGRRLRNSRDAVKSFTVVTDDQSSVYTYKTGNYTISQHVGSIIETHSHINDSESFAPSYDRINTLLKTLSTKDVSHNNCFFSRLINSSFTDA